MDAVAYLGREQPPPVDTATAEVARPARQPRGDAARLFAGAVVDLGGDAAAQQVALLVAETTILLVVPTETVTRAASIVGSGSALGVRLERRIVFLCETPGCAPDVGRLDRPLG